MIISVASGKGGTGKTTVACALAESLGEDACFLDCDVEEPNAHIFLKPKIQSSAPVKILVPQVDESKCYGSGMCARVCEYNAISIFNRKPFIIENLCHGCGGCKLACTFNAIQEKEKELGDVFTGVAMGKINFISGKTNVGVASSVPVIKKVRSHGNGAAYTIIDAPPGTSCSMVQSVKGSDVCILVTEPTPFGFHDLKLSIEVLKKMRIPFGVIINRSDIGDEQVKRHCQQQSIPVLLELPHEREIAEAYSKGISITQLRPQMKKQFREILNTLKGELNAAN
jgi:MinD superfamily P-loop ATPase